MDHQTHPKRPAKEGKSSNPLKYTFDGRFLPNIPPDTDTTETTGSNTNNSETGLSSEREYSCPEAVSLAASFQLIAGTMTRMELAELEMMKKRETARLEAQQRRAELEDEMTRMMLQTQLHIASLVSQRSRKRRSLSSGDDDDDDDGIPGISGTNMY